MKQTTALWRQEHDFCSTGLFQQVQAKPSTLTVIRRYTHDSLLDDNVASDCSFHCKAAGGQQPLDVHEQPSWDWHLRLVWSQVHAGFNVQNVSQASPPSIVMRVANDDDDHQSCPDIC